MRWFGKIERNPAEPLYSDAVAFARDTRWYRQAGVPDTMDGRYCVLATLLALADLALGARGPEGRALSPRLTELFVADMDAQLCQSGMGDPTLGKTVRAMVAGVSARIARLERAIASAADQDWRSALALALFRDDLPGEERMALARALIDEWRAILEEPGRLPAAAE